MSWVQPAEFPERSNVSISGMGKMNVREGEGETDRCIKYYSKRVGERVERREGGLWITYVQ